MYGSSGLEFIRHKDWLGSSRLATTWAHGIYSKEAYAPFGEPYNEAGTTDRSFTGQDPDTTQGVYDFMFRRYDPTAGRWLSPDPAGWSSVDRSTPQSLDRYAYVRNNPLSLTDALGLDGCKSGDDNDPDNNDTSCLGLDNGDGGDDGEDVDANGLDDGEDGYYGGPCGPGIAPCETVYVTANEPQLLPYIPGCSELLNCSYLEFLASQIQTPPPNTPSNGQQYQPQKTPSKFLKYVTFLGCELNNDIAQLTDEEDAQTPMQIPIVVSATAVVGTLNGKLPGWTGVTGAITGGLYAINIAGNSNKACSPAYFAP